MPGAKQTLLDICKLIVDCEHKTAPTQDTGYPSIRTPNIGRGRLLLDGVNRVSEETYREWSKRAIPQAADLILAREAPIGNVAIIPKNLKVCLGQRTVLIRPNKNKVCPMFLVYFMLGNEIQSRLLGPSTGATVSHLNMRDIRNLEIPKLPSLRIQRKIADILSGYDDLIEINQQRVALLERAGREIYREWFVRLRFPGYERAKIVDGVPEGWERVHLSRLVSTQYGYTASANEKSVGPKFLRGTDINKRSYIDWEAVPYCPEDNLNFENYALRQGDLLVIRMADPGKVAIVEKEIRAIFASYLVRLSVRKDALIDPLYLFYVLAGAEYQAFMQAASTGSTRKSASAKLLTNFNVLRPPKSIQDCFVDKIRPMREMIGMLLDQNSMAETARDLMLPRLMSGQLIVC